MLRAPVCPNSAHLPRTKSGGHTHLVCTSEMRRKVSRSSSVYQPGAGAHARFTSRLCSKWTVMLLTCRPLLDVLLWSLDRPPAASLHLSSHLSFRLCEQSPAPSSSACTLSSLLSRLVLMFSSLSHWICFQHAPSVSASSTIHVYHFPPITFPPVSISTSLCHPPSAVTRRSKLETCVTTSH